MSGNWLQSYLLDSVRKNLCTQILCTTCGAMEFRKGVVGALPGMETQKPDRIMEYEDAVPIAAALAGVQGPDRDLGPLKKAVRCLLFDLCYRLGEQDAARILGDSWGGTVLLEMQLHHRARMAARQVHNHFEATAPARREEKKRLSQERHRQRLELKKERDRVWREAQSKQGATKA